MYYVYIIKSEEGFIYTGQTDNPQRRLFEHNNHSLSRWTKKGNNWKIVHLEEFLTRAEAMKREKWLKTGKGREFLKSIL